MRAKLTSRSIATPSYPVCSRGSSHTFLCRGEHREVEITVKDDYGNSFSGLDHDAEIEIEVTFKIKPTPPKDRIIKLS